MADTGSAQWDVQGLAFGLAVGLLGVLLFLGRSGDALRPVHLLGVVVLAVGTAYLVDALDRHRPVDDPDADRVIDLS